MLHINACQQHSPPNTRCAAAPPWAQNNGLVVVLHGVGTQITVVVRRAFVDSSLRVGEAGQGTQCEATSKIINKYKKGVIIPKQLERNGRGGHAAKNRSLNY